jgi:hypothetical protein
LLELFDGFDGERIVLRRRGEVRLFLSAIATGNGSTTVT